MPLRRPHFWALALLLSAVSNLRADVAVDFNTASAQLDDHFVLASAAYHAVSSAYASPRGKRHAFASPVPWPP